ncbi:MAG: S8 family serine peptidase [Anaerolineales bacterium]|nr:S8 family serine peptidase [Anaerolineales bacterium]
MSSSFVPNQIVVRFSSELSNDTKRRILRQADVKPIEEIPNINATVLQASNGNIQSTIDDLLQQQGVIYAEPNYYVEMTDLIPNDPGWNNQYNLTAIRAPAGWALNTGAVWVTIAILDSGVELSHPDLFVRILPGYDFVNNDNDPQDDNGHGTHVAAIAAASSNNGVGIAGVNWGTNILPVKVLNASGNGTYANVAAGIVWATDYGVQVINLSLGGATPSFLLSDAVDYAYNHGVTLVASTGNAGSPAVLYPAAYSAVIAVGATDSSNAWAGFSNYGPEVDVVAPGADIYSAYPGGGYGYRSGTSMSAPHVSGLAAILWGIPGNGPASVRSIIESTARDLGSPGWDPYFGNGLIQMDAAILQTLPSTTSSPTIIVELEPVQTTVAPPQKPILTNATAFTETLTFSISQTPFTLASANETLTPTQLMNTVTAEPEVYTTAQADDNWIGCCGVLLLLLGIFLFLMNFKSRKKWHKYL